MNFNSEQINYSYWCTLLNKLFDKLNKLSCFLLDTEILFDMISGKSLFGILIWYNFYLIAEQILKLA